MSFLLCVQELDNQAQRLPTRVYLHIPRLPLPNAIERAGRSLERHSRVQV